MWLAELVNPWARLPAPEYLMTSALLAHAWRFAAERHADQVRWDGAPFVLHPLEVGSLLSNHSEPDHVVAAGVLHDTLEKTSATSSDLDPEFGPEITRLVVAVSDDPALEGYAERKRDLRTRAADAGRDALAVLVADKVTKVRELRGQLTRRPHPLTPIEQRRLGHYELSCDLLRSHAPGLPLARQLEFEL
jgi:(p)ppGpp synthase/HD superfamily hydrolase